MAKSRNLDKKRSERGHFGGAAQTHANTQGQSKPKPTEGIRIRGQAQPQEQGRYEDHGGRHGCTPGKFDRRSKSPEQDTSRNSRNPSIRERTPLKDRITRDVTSDGQQSNGIETPDLSVNAHAKRKRGNTESEDKEDRKRSRKEEPVNFKHTVAAVAVKKNDAHVKEAKNKKIIDIKLSEEMRRELRSVKFARPVVPKVAADTPEAGPKQVELLAPEIEDDGKPTPTARGKDPFVKKADEKRESSKLKIEDGASETQMDSHPCLTPKERLIEPPPKALAATVDAPKRDTERPVPIGGVKTDQQHANVDPSSSSNASSGTTCSTNLKRKRPFGDTPSLEEASCEPEPKKLTTLDIVKKRGEKILQHEKERLERKEKFPEDVLNYIDYGVYSMPIMRSGSIEHYHPTALMDEPSNELKATLSANAIKMFGRKMLLLRRDALALSKKKFLTSKILGRKHVQKTKPSRVIDDCDLYLYEGKIHVATERGLLLAADYLKLIGVPDSQPVRFNGYKPAWTKEMEAKHHRRHVLQEFVPPDALIKEGVIGLELGSTVLVYDLGIFARDPETNKPSWMAYGVRTDSIEGWFPYYEETCRIDWCADATTPAPANPNGCDYSNMIDWGTFDYQPLADRAAAEYQAHRAEAAAGAALCASLTASAPVSQPPTPQTTAASPAVSASPVVSAPSPIRSSPRTAVPPTASGTLIEDSNIEVVTEASSTKIIADTTLEVSTNAASDVASSQSTQSQEETVMLLSVSGGPISRYDSPQDGSEKATSEQGNDEANGNDDGEFQPDGPIPEDEVVAEDGFVGSEPAAVEQPAAPTRVIATKKVDEYGENIVVDWDDWDDEL